MNRRLPYPLQNAWITLRNLPLRQIDGRVALQHLQKRLRKALTALSLLLSASSLALATGASPLNNAEWHADYAAATTSAEKTNRRLLIVFQQSQQDRDYTAVLETADDPALQQLLDEYELARVPVGQVVRIGGQSQRLIDHSAFKELLGGPGIAIIDLRDSASKSFRSVISVVPFGASIRSAPSTEWWKSLLSLPDGTLTQRTLIFAIRIHADKPKSTDGKLSSTLVDEAKAHSQHQATIRRQGHHSWETRFHRINAKLPSNLVCREVCAESWPGEGLFEAAVECVHSWRQSFGHWDAVRSPHPLYGFDMRLGSNHVWYATGIVADRH